jgi:hypothetical protein
MAGDPLGRPAGQSSGGSSPGRGPFSTAAARWSERQRWERYLAGRDNRRGTAAPSPTPQQPDWMRSQDLGISCGDHPRRTQLRSIDPNASPAKMVHGERCLCEARPIQVSCPMHVEGGSPMHRKDTRDGSVGVRLCWLRWQRKSGNGLTGREGQTVRGRACSTC